MLPFDPAELERLTLQAWPPTQLGRLGDWRMAASAGFAMRINSAWPLGEAGVDHAEAILAVEAWYAARAAPTRFKLADGVTPPGLEAALTGAGYRMVSETLVMLGPTGAGRAADAVITEQPDEAFAAVFIGAGGGADEAVERLDALRRMPRPAVFARLDVEGGPAAIGACPIQGDWAGLFAMRTVTAMRRRGLARRLAETLLSEAASRGARRAYLQVEATNQPAIALYRGLGFEAAYAYRYAVRP